MKKLLCLPIAALIMLCSCADSSSEHIKTLYCMDTHMTLKAYGDKAEAEHEKAVGTLVDLDAKWSVTNTDSEIYKVNHAGGGTVQVWPETSELVSFGRDMYEKSDRTLDISIYPILLEWGFTIHYYKVPAQERISKLLWNVNASKISVNGSGVTVPADMMIDLGSVAKGAASDMICDELRKAGVESAVLDLGGNIQTLGSKPGSGKWKIGIRDPEGSGVIGSVSVENKAVVTSGGYERQFTENGKTYHHIIDPSTGWPAESGLVSVTVIGDSGRMCDALSTSLFIMGAEKAYHYWRKTGGFDYIALTKSGELLVSSGIAEDFDLDKDHKNIKVTVVK